MPRRPRARRSHRSSRCTDRAPWDAPSSSRRLDGRERATRTE